MTLTSRTRRRVAVLMIGVLSIVFLSGWTLSATAVAITGPPPGTLEWLQDTTLNHSLPHPTRSTPQQISHFFSSLSEGERQYLSTTHPSVVGNMDGAPLALRYTANARAYAQHYGREISDERQLLAFDPRGRGRFAEVFGDLTTAQHVAVIVPGVSADLGTHTGVTRAARNLQREMETTTTPMRTTATIAWVGYTTPSGGIEVATNRLAAIGAVQLDRFLARLAVQRGSAPLPTLICHSYGSVVCGQIYSTEVSDIILVSSPGTSRSHADHLPSDARVWSTQQNSADWIHYVPNVQFLGLGHGTDPQSEEFGAPLLRSDGSHGHPGYFAPHTVSLRNFAAVTRGTYSETVCVQGACV